MSVRRLAEDSVQPKSFAFNPIFAAKAKTWVKKYPKGREQSAVIPLLMLAQEQEGWVTKAAIEYIADMLGMPYIRALEVATFYTQFQLKPVGTRAHVQVCGTTPCMLRGAEALMDVCRAKIHPEPFHTNASGTLSWEEVECQGACVNAPMVMIFKDTYEDLTPERLAYIIDRFEAGRPGDVVPGPQIDRIYSAPAGGPTTLLEDPTVKKSKAPSARAGAKSPPPTQAAKPEGGGEGALTTSRPVTPLEKRDEANAAAGIVTPLAKGRGAKASTPVAGVAAPVVPAAASAAKSKAPATPRTGRVAPAAAAKAEAVARPKLDDPNRPAAAERPAVPDDLKLISGVGPKVEATLHSLGIYTFAQIASWKEAERRWVDGYLNFKGRIEREDWVRQADALARGGRDEYVRVFGKEPR